MAYMTVAQLRDAVPQLSEEGKYTSAQLAGYVAEFEELAELYRGVAYEPRTAVETYTLTENVAEIVLRHTRVRSVTSVVIDGTTVSAGTYTFTDHGTIVSRVGFLGTWTLPVMTVVVTYSHGYTSPPQTILRACREYCRMVALADRSAAPRDIISQSVEGMTTRYSTPDWGAGRPTGYLDVDRLLNAQQDERMGFA